MRALIVGMIVTAFLFMMSAPASAHAGEEGVPAMTSVEEAIAIIATQPEQMDAIGDKIGDAQESDDTDGVDVALVEQAGAAFESEDLDTTLLLLEQSIGVQPGEMMTDVTSGEASPAPPPPSAEPRDSPLLASSGHRVSGVQASGLLILTVLSMSVGVLLVRRFR